MDLIINFTPTGMIPQKGQTPHVPIYPTEIIEQTHEAYEVGITLVHLHARENNGIPTYKKSVYHEIFSGIKKHCPDLVICASLSGRNFPELEKRSEVLSLKPDMGSLTLSSLNFHDTASINSPSAINGLISEMERYGVNPELECFDAGMVNYANYLIHKGLIKPPFYFNLLFGSIASAQADMSFIGPILKELPHGSYWSLAGIGKEQLKMNAIAIAFNGGVRVGLEDNIWFDKNRKTLATNIALLKRIHQLSEIFERQVMNPETFGQLGFYNTQNAR